MTSAPMTNSPIGQAAPQFLQAQPAPRRARLAAGWRRAGFATPLQSALSVSAALLLGALVYWIVLRFPAIEEGLRTAWAMGADDGGGTLRALLGEYPLVEAWRPALVLCLFAVLLLRLCVGNVRRRPLCLWLLVLQVPLMLALLRGGVPGLAAVPVSHWGGALVTFVLMSLALALALPLSLLLALAQQAQSRLLALLSVGSVQALLTLPPLIVLLALFVLAQGFAALGSGAALALAALALALLAAARTSLPMRAGLELLSHGPTLAARALGLSWWQRLRLVILPLLLQTQTPALVRGSADLLKTTALVCVIGINDPLQWALAAAPITNPMGTQAHAVPAALLLLALLFWSLGAALTHLGARLSPTPPVA